MAAATAKKKRSREDYELELHRLQSMYNKLPPAKQAVHRPHMQARIDKLIKAMKEDEQSSRGSGIVTTLLVIVLACAVALGVGFFGVTYFVNGG